MPLPSSGAISLNQINTEFGRGLNLNAYRGTQYYTASAGPFTFPSGAIAFSDFYGTQLVSPKSVSYTASFWVGSALVTSHSVSGVSIGTAASNRYVYLAIMTSYTFHTWTPTNVSIGGVAATLLYSAPANWPHRVHFFGANVTSGTTATISYNTANSVVTQGNVWAAYGMSSPLTVQSSAGSTDNSNPVTLNVTCQASDVILGQGNMIDASGTGPSWTGITLNVFQNVVDTTQGRTFYIGAGSLLTSASGQNISYNYGASGVWRAAAVIVLR